VQRGCRAARRSCGSRLLLTPRAPLLSPWQPEPAARARRGAPDQQAGVAGCAAHRGRHRRRGGLWVGRARAAAPAQPPAAAACEPSCSEGPHHQAAGGPPPGARRLQGSRARGACSAGASAALTRPPPGPCLRQVPGSAGALRAVQRAGAGGGDAAGTGPLLPPQQQAGAAVGALPKAPAGRCAAWPLASPASDGCSRVFGAPQRPGWP
jgi:hypothetical protein